MNIKGRLVLIGSYIIKNLKAFFITIENIISIDKSGRTFYNTSNNYRNRDFL